MPRPARRREVGIDGVRDVITLMPDTIDTSHRIPPLPTGCPFCATDHYPVDPTLANTASPWGSAWDVKNEWFTLTAPLPPLTDASANWDMDNVEFLSGLCWSGRDLSTLNGVSATALAKGLMPRLSGFATDYDLATGAPEWVLGGVSTPQAA